MLQIAFSLAENLATAHLEHEGANPLNSSVTVTVRCFSSPKSLGTKEIGERNYSIGRFGS